jgi:hypothetical protein
LKGATAAHIKANLDADYTPPTPAQIVGINTHDVCHEDAKIFCLPEGMRRGTKKFDAWELENGLPSPLRVMKKADYDLCMRMVESVRTTPASAELYEGSTLEMSGFLPHAEYGLLKIRPDCKREHMMADLKTCAQGDAESVSKACANFGYMTSAAFYMDIGSVIDGCDYTEWHWIFVEKKPPYLTTVYQPGDDMIEKGRELYLRSLDWIAHGNRTGEWPGYPGGVVELPRWFNA